MRSTRNRLWRRSIPTREKKASAASAASYAVRPEEPLSSSKWRLEGSQVSVLRDGSSTSSAPPQDKRFISDRTSQLSRSEEHTSELQSLMRISYAVFCLKKKNQ